jgi:hypothetical protein
MKQREKSSTFSPLRSTIYESSPPTSLMKRHYAGSPAAPSVAAASIFTGDFSLTFRIERSHVKRTTGAVVGITNI